MDFTNNFNLGLSYTQPDNGGTNDSQQSLSDSDLLAAIDILEDKPNFDQDNTEKPVENPQFQVSAHDDINKVIDEGTLCVLF